VLKVFTRKREEPFLRDYLNQFNIPFEIHKSVSTVKLEPFELGVSYNFLSKIEQPLLSLARKGFVNYHPAPLPEYPSGPEFELSTTERAIKDKVLRWGVTLHYMDEEYDSGPIIRKTMFELEEPPHSKDEIGSLTHWHLWKLFKTTVLDIYHFGNPINDEFIRNYV